MYHTQLTIHVCAAFAVGRSGFGTSLRRAVMAYGFMAST